MKKRPDYLGPVIVFVILNGLILSMRSFLERKNIDQEVLIYANLLMFLLTLAGVFMHRKAIGNPNPNVFIRSVMSATVLKLFVLGGAVFLYIALAGDAKNEKTILIAGILYFIYTFLEVRIAMAMNSKKHEKN